MNFEVSTDAFEPVEGADERLLADDESYFFEEKKGRGKKGGKSRGEGKFDRGKGKAQEAPANATWSVPPSTSASSRPKRATKSTFPPIRTTTTAARRSAA